MDNMGNTMKKQNFMQGAAILIIGNFLVKLIGGALKIPLTFILKEEGMAVFNTAYQVYAMLFAISTAGIPVAVSKIVAESMAIGQVKDTKRIFTVALAILSGIGLVGMLVLFFGARQIASLMGDTKIVYCVMAVSPAIFFITIVASYRGFFQGMQNMIPTAVSQIIEALGKLVIGVILAYSLISISTFEIAATGAILGVTSGTAISAVVLTLMYFKSKSQIYSGYENVPYSKSKREIAKTILTIAIPITIGASVTSVTAVVDTAMIRANLQRIVFSPETAQALYNTYSGFSNNFDDITTTLKITESGARWLYGAYSGYAMTLFNIAPSIVVSIGMSLVPAIVSAYAVNNLDGARESTQTALRITLIIALPCVAGLEMLSAPVLKLIFNNSASSILLRLLSPAIIWMTVVTVTTSILQATGRVMVPFWNMVIGAVIKIVVNWFAVSNPYLYIHGAPIGTNLCYLFVAASNLYFLKKTIDIKYDVVSILLKPLLCAAAMGAVVWLMYNPLESILHSGRFATVADILIGGLVYLVMLVLTGSITKQDVNMIIKRKK